MPANGRPDTPLDELESMLAEARTLAKTLLDDPHLERLIRAFGSGELDGNFAFGALDGSHRGSS